MTTEQEDGHPRLTRRQALLAAAGAVVLGPGLARLAKVAGAATDPAATDPDVFDAGPLGGFAQDKVYGEHREDGFFVIRRGGEVFALSSVCTHKGCLVRAQPDQSYHCKCHGSNFSPDGTVTKGPAERDLPRLKVSTDAANHVLVDLGREFRPDAK